MNGVISQRERTSAPLLSLDSQLLGGVVILSILRSYCGTDTNYTVAYHCFVLHFYCC